MSTKALIITLVALLAVIAAAGYFLSVYSPQAPDGDYRSMSPEERQKLLDTLSASGGSQLSKEEETRALKSLSTSSPESQVPGKSEVLKSLQAN